MSFIFSQLKGALTNLGARFYGHHDHEDDISPYQHGIPGIPTDGKVVLLKNSELKSKVYLVGTIHISKQSAETVKKVINHVKPNVVAIELCKESAASDMNWNLKDLPLFDVLCGSMSAPGGLCMKIGIFALGCSYHKLLADGIFPNLEFKVAMDESWRVRARCVPIDQDQNVTLEKVSKVLSWQLLWQSLFADDKKFCLGNYYRQRVSKKDRGYTRSSVQEDMSLMKKHQPELFKVLMEDRDKIMFERIRTFEEKVVAVVGMAHMDGIEALWKQAEESDTKQPPVTSE